MENELLTALEAFLQTPFWEKWEFWIASLLSVVGVGFSWAAFIQAKSAKEAAIKAGRLTKKKSAIPELVEISNTLDVLESNVSYKEARDIFGKESRKIRRLITPFMSDDNEEIKMATLSIKNTIGETLDALSEAKPSEDTDPATASYAVFRAVEGYLTKLNGQISELVGLIEIESIDRGHGYERS
jgi:hypothetical protein